MYSPPLVAIALALSVVGPVGAMDAESQQWKHGSARTDIREGGCVNGFRESANRALAIVF